MDVEVLNRPRAGRGVIMDVEVIDQGLVGE